VIYLPMHGLAVRLKAFFSVLPFRSSCLGPGHHTPEQPRRRREIGGFGGAEPSLSIIWNSRLPRAVRGRLYERLFLLFLLRVRKFCGWIKAETLCSITT
jgi:hypothetical protein